MRYSHTCTSCGTELAHVRAVREPYYGLPIVTCPHCALVVVRRRHPLEKWLHTCLRIDALALALILQLGFAFWSLALTIALSVAFAHALTQGQFTELAPASLFPTVVAFLFVAVLLGAWMTAGLAHWRWWTRYVGLWGLAAALMTLDTIFEPIFFEVVRQHEGGPSIPFQWGEYGLRLLTLTAIFCLSLTGAPIGLLVRHVARVFRRWRFRWRRRRMRARRMNA